MSGERKQSDQEPSPGDVSITVLGSVQHGWQVRWLDNGTQKAKVFETKEYGGPGSAKEAARFFMRNRLKHQNEH